MEHEQLVKECLGVFERTSAKSFVDPRQDPIYQDYCFREASIDISVATDNTKNDADFVLQHQEQLYKEESSK